jgi:hypothetical protein
MSRVLLAPTLAAICWEGVRGGFWPAVIALSMTLVTAAAYISTDSLVRGRGPRSARSRDRKYARWP